MGKASSTNKEDFAMGSTWNNIFFLGSYIWVQDSNIDEHTTNIEIICSETIKGSYEEEAPCANTLEKMELKGYQTDLLKEQKILKLQQKLNKTITLLVEERAITNKATEKTALERQRANYWENKCLEVRQKSEDLTMKLEEAERRVHQLEESSKRFVERMTNLEMENKCLRQQALSMIQSNHILTSRTKSLITKSSQIPSDKQQEDHDLLIHCVTKQLGFSKGRPIAAMVTYKCLRHWRSFEAEKTNIFDRVIQTIDKSLEAQDNNANLCYWLTNTTSLLLLLQNESKLSDPDERCESSSRTLLLRRLKKIYGPKEAKCPTNIFKQNLTTYVEKICGMIRDNLRKEISPLLDLCVQLPRTKKINSLTNDGDIEKDTLLAHWKKMVQMFSKYLEVMRVNYVPPFFIRELYTQVFSYINVQLFNRFLLKRECCSFSNGEYVNSGLIELENWCYDVTEEYVGSALEELNHIREVTIFLIIHQKPQKTLDEVRHDLCPALSIQQIHMLSTLYHDDEYGKNSLSPEVIAKMQVLMTEESNSLIGGNFQLDDDSSKPFSIDEFAKSAKQITISDIESPSLLRDHSCFDFLLPPCQ